MSLRLHDPSLWPTQREWLSMVSSGGVRTLAQLKRRLIETPLASPAAADGAFGALLWVLSELPKPRLALFWETTLLD